MPWAFLASIVLLTLPISTVYAGSKLTVQSPPSEQDVKGSTVNNFDHTLLHKLPHDPSAFTQGLEFSGEYLLESTGQYGHSALRVYAFPEMKLINEVRLESEYFGEGMTVFREKIYQLTWRSGRCFVYALASLKPIRSYQFKGQGWGLAHDDRHLIMSDGSARLRFFDPEHFTQVKQIHVTERGKPLYHLNELEYVEGILYANVWKEERIVAIDLSTAKVIASINLAGLPDKQHKGTNVLNGIAYHPEQKALWITGKFWSWLYQIDVIPTPLN